MILSSSLPEIMVFIDFVEFMILLFLISYEIFSDVAKMALLPLIS